MSLIASFLAQLFLSVKESKPKLEDDQILRIKEKYSDKSVFTTNSFIPLWKKASLGMLITFIPHAIMCIWICCDIYQWHGNSIFTFLWATLAFVFGIINIFGIMFVYEKININMRLIPNIKPDMENKKEFIAVKEFQYEMYFHMFLISIVLSLIQSIPLLLYFIGDDIAIITDVEIYTYNLYIGLCLWICTISSVIIIASLPGYELFKSEIDRKMDVIRKVESKAINCYDISSYNEQIALENKNAAIIQKEKEKEKKELDDRCKYERIIDRISVNSGYFILFFFAIYIVIFIVNQIASSYANCDFLQDLFNYILGKY